MQGTLETREVPAPSLEGNPLGDPARRQLTVYLPPGYTGSQARYPVVYFLHAYGNGGGAWLNRQGFSPNVPDRLDRLVVQGRIPPVIGVFPDGWTRVGGSQWVNSEAVGRYRDFVVKDVVAHVDRTYRTLPAAASRAVVGHSSGGYGALVMGRFHPDVFGHLGVQSADAYFEYCYLGELPKAAGALLKAGGVEPWFREFEARAQETKLRGDDHGVINVLAMAAAYSPKKGEPLNVELPFDPSTAKLRLEVWNRWLVNDPVRFVPKYIDAFKKLRSVFIDCGTRDEFNLRWGARLVAEELKAGGVDVHHEEFEDGHMQVNYRYEASLGHLVPKLTRE